MDLFANLSSAAPGGPASAKPGDKVGDQAADESIDVLAEMVNDAVVMAPHVAPHIAPQARLIERPPRPAAVVPEQAAPAAPAADADITLPPSAFKPRADAARSTSTAVAQVPLLATTLPPPGWHGKLPSLGDFASRRLDAAFVTAWDEWLASGLLGLRDAAPEAWLPAYLASPSWRFLLMPGVLPGPAGTSAWAGVLMPSVDRVGRYFPLTLVQKLGQGPDTPQALQALWPWLGRLDELAQDALHDDWSVERLEAELLRLAPLEAAVPAASQCNGAALHPSQYAVPGSVCQLSLASSADAALHLAQQAQLQWAQQAVGQAWWYARPDAQPARFWQSGGLPGDSAFGFLFGAGVSPLVKSGWA